MILLSAGHHPAAVGACYNGFCEHDEAVKWVDELNKLLTPRIDTMIVPTGRLQSKIDYINKILSSTSEAVFIKSNLQSYGK